MKKIILFFLVFTVSVALFSQQTNPSVALTKQDYLQKSKNQKITGFVLLGVGAACIAIAAPGNVSFDVLPVLVISGALATLGSIPFFIAAGKNKKRGMSISLRNEKAPQIQKAGFVYRNVPSLSLKISL